MYLSQLAMISKEFMTSVHSHSKRLMVCVPWQCELSSRQLSRWCVCGCQIIYGYAWGLVERWDC